MTQKSLEERITRLEDIHEIQNLMSRYEYYHSAKMQEETVELFAQKTLGVTAEISSWGVYEDIEGIRKLFLRVHRWRGDPPGDAIEHDLTTPVIEVAGDGKTAKGVWASPGWEAHPDAKTGEPQPSWCWVKYAVDFVKEDGKWKFWHFHVYTTFNTPFDKGWVKFPHPSVMLPREAYGFPSKDYPPDKPTTYHKPYDPSGVPEFVPAPPKPYETYEE